MAERDAPPARSSSAPRRAAPPPATSSLRFDRAKRHLVASCAAVGLGLGCAGSFDRTAGGLLVLVGWAAALVSLHRLGRAGAEVPTEAARR